MIDYSTIQQVHLEISTRCNASCPLCPRNLSGYDTELGYPLHDMSLTEAQKIFPVDFLRQLKKILINGNFGDFVTAKDGLDIVKYFSESNPNLQIEISSNASAKPAIWAQLGAIPNVTVGFAIDGLEDTHGKYRRNTNWHMVIDNAKRFIAAGGTAIWRMIKFDHNYHQVDICKQMSKELGFAKFDLLDDGRDAGPVYDRYGNYLYKLGNDANFTDVQYPLNVVTWSKWTAPGSTPEARLKEYPTIPIKEEVSCRSKNYKEIYITATGEVYPCCWLGFYPKLDYKQPWQQDNMFVKDMAQNNNALDVGIAAAVEWFNGVEDSWNKKAYADGRLFKCDQYCGRNQEVTIL